MTLVCFIMLNFWFNIFTDAPSNVRIIDKFGADILQNTALPPGEQLLCTAISNPPVNQYMWTDASNGRILGHVAALEIQDTWEGLMILQCIVRNLLTTSGNMEGKGSLNVTIHALGKFGLFCSL